jgi:hypothetical protein
MPVPGRHIVDTSAQHFQQHGSCPGLLGPAIVAIANHISPENTGSKVPPT